jgi:hypothetical protein
LWSNIYPQIHSHEAYPITICDIIALQILQITYHSDQNLLRETN